MIEINNALASIFKLIEPTFSENGFQVVIPENIKNGEPPINVHNNVYQLVFTGEGNALKIKFAENKISLLLAEMNAQDATDDNYTQLSLSLLDTKTATDGDLKYIANDFSETIKDKFGVKEKKATIDGKMPATVSRTAARSGAMAYDANTLASRLATAYPELREPYKENIATYGTFLSEEFFRKYGTKVIIDTIRENDRQKMKKLFNILNDIFADGTNDIQSLITVSVLSEMNNDSQLLENAKEYMSDELAPYVIELNRFFVTNQGKKAREKMLNPPPYKPKKEKKKSTWSQTLGLG